MTEAKGDTVMVGHRCCLLLCCVLAAGGVLAGEAEWNHEVGLNTGYDSNPLKLPDNEKGGGFTEAAFDGGLDFEYSRRNAFHLDLEAKTRRHGSSLSDADRTTAGLAAGFELTPYVKDFSALQLDVGTRLAVRRGTFTSRQSGQVFEVDDGGGTFVAIPDRFDYNRMETFANLEWRLNLRTQLFLDSEYTFKDYVEDYHGIATVESLDYDGLTFRPGARFDATSMLNVELSAIRTDREYDERTSVDTTGTSVPGTLREYVYTGFDAKLRLRPENRWRWTFALQTLDREDTWAGYYDYTSWTARVWTRFRISSRDRLILSTSLSDREYDNSTVNSELNGELRSSETLRLRAAFTRKLTRRFDVTVEAGLRSVDNPNALYEYDRDSLGVWIGYN